MRGGEKQVSELHAALAQMLRSDAFVTLLNLEENELGDEGIVSIAESLHSHPTIFRLDLGYNAGGPKCLKAIAVLLLESPSLLCLDLSGNNLCSRLSMLGPSSMSALAPIGKALAVTLRWASTGGGVGRRVDVHGELGAESSEAEGAEAMQRPFEALGGRAALRSDGD